MSFRFIFSQTLKIIAHSEILVSIHIIMIHFLIFPRRNLIYIYHSGDFYLIFIVWGRLLSFDLRCSNRSDKDRHVSYCMSPSIWVVIYVFSVSVILSVFKCMSHTVLDCIRLYDSYCMNHTVWIILYMSNCRNHSVRLRVVWNISYPGLPLNPRGRNLAHLHTTRLGYVYRLGWILRWINRNWTSASEIRSDFRFEPNQKRVQFRIHKPNKIKDQFSGSFVRIYIYLTDYSSNKCQFILKVVS